MTIQQLVIAAYQEKNLRESSLTVTYSGSTYILSTLLTSQWLSIYENALREQGANPRGVALPSTLMPTTFTNSQIIDLINTTIENYQTHLDAFSFICSQINALVITDASQISAAWDAYLSTYVNPRTTVATNESLANSIASITATLSSLPIPIQADWTQSNNTLLSFILHKPTLATVATTGVYSDLSGKPTIPSAQIQSDWSQASSGSLDFIKNKPVSKSYTYPTRALNTAYQISTSQDAFASVAVDISATLTLTGGQTGTVILEYADDSGISTNVKTVCSTANGNTGTLTIGLALTQTATASLSGYIPVSKYYRVRTANTTGAPTFTLRNIQETLL